MEMDLCTQVGIGSLDTFDLICFIMTTLRSKHCIALRRKRVDILFTFNPQVNMRINLNVRQEEWKNRTVKIPYLSQ